MADRLIAIGVKNADSFFLQRDNRNALIDGGLSEKEFPQLFKEATNSIFVDILVCTHADKDHLGGLLGYLKDSDLKCSELWGTKLFGIQSRGNHEKS